MKIAIFHNYMDNIGGAEKVTLTLAGELDADIITTNINRKAIENMGFKNIRIKSIGKIPINAPFKQQFALYKFRKLDLKEKYDFFIIDGDWAISGAVKNKPNLWYVHSPIREIWDLYEYTRQHSVPLILRPIFDIWVKYNRYLNRKYVKHVDKITCNSKNTQKRVKKYLNRAAVVINPPIETSKFHYKKTGGYWLSVNRLITHKRADMQIKAFAKLLDEKLIVVGCYEKSRHFTAYANYIKKIKPKNITLLNGIGSNQLINLYANCKGFITTSKDEDFGMAPVEAMASGKPVIAPNEGGYKETVVDGVTGKLIDDISVDKLIKSIQEVSKNPKKYKNTCLKQAKKFDTKIFIKKIKEQMAT
ncbi:mannosyl transferase [Candidatus Woesearchaeota archaeon B3_Woes]|nr:MAG: mannosyl transferase [Candidatus Woesearchaeota archaeon B3_Woes]